MPSPRARTSTTRSNDTAEPIAIAARMSASPASSRMSRRTAARRVRCGGAVRSPSIQAPYSAANVWSARGSRRST